MRKKRLLGRLHRFLYDTGLPTHQELDNQVCRWTVKSQQNGYDDKPISLVLVAKLFAKIEIVKLCLPKYMLLLTEWPLQ